jgi:hypothetical protein
MYTLIQFFPFLKCVYIFLAPSVCVRVCARAHTHTHTHTHIHIHVQREPFKLMQFDTQQLIRSVFFYLNFETFRFGLTMNLIMIFT